MALERPEVETQADMTLPPVDRQRKKLGDLSRLFCDAHGYVEVKGPATKRKADGTGYNAGSACPIRGVCHFYDFGIIRTVLKRRF